MHSLMGGLIDRLYACQATPRVRLDDINDGHPPKGLFVQALIQQHADELFLLEQEVALTVNEHPLLLIHILKGSNKGASLMQQTICLPAGLLGTAIGNEWRAIQT